MNRRDFLTRGAVAVGSIAALSGCTEETLEQAEKNPLPIDEAVAEEEIDLPVDQRLEAAGEGIDRAEDAEIESVDDLETYLVEQGVQVEALEEKEAAGLPIVSLEYVDEEVIERGMMHNLGIVAGGYAALVAADHDSEKLEASLLAPDGETFGEYTIESEWAEEYDDGEITAREYANDVVTKAASA